MESPVVELVNAVRKTSEQPLEFLEAFLDFLVNAEQNCKLLEAVGLCDHAHAEWYNRLRLECFLLNSPEPNDFTATVSGGSFVNACAPNIVSSSHYEQHLTDELSDPPDSGVLSSGALLPHSEEIHIQRSATERSLLMRAPEQSFNSLPAAPAALISYEYNKSFPHHRRKNTRRNVTIPQELTSSRLATVFPEDTHTVAFGLQNLTVSVFKLEDVRRELAKIEHQLEKNRNNAKKADKARRAASVLQTLLDSLEAEVSSSFTSLIQPMYMDCKRRYAQACRLLLQATDVPMPPIVPPDASDGVSVGATSFATETARSAEETTVSQQGSGQVRALPTPCVVDITSQSKKTFRTYTFDRLRVSLEALGTHFGLLVDYFSRLSRKARVPLPPAMDDDLRRIRSALNSYDRDSRQRDMDNLMHTVFRHRKYLEITYSVHTQLHEVEKKIRRAARRAKTLPSEEQLSQTPAETPPVALSAKLKTLRIQETKLRDTIAAERVKLLGDDTSEEGNLFDLMLNTVRTSLSDLAQIIEPAAASAF